MTNGQKWLVNKMTLEQNDQVRNGVLPTWLVFKMPYFQNDFQDGKFSKWNETLTRCQNDQFQNDNVSKCQVDKMPSS